MPPPAPPALTVRYDGSERTFAAGHDVVVGRDLRADMRITHPLISRAHLLLRFDQGRWLAIDNNSLNGTYSNGRRVPVIDLYDGQTVNIGPIPDNESNGNGVSDDTFNLGYHQGLAVANGHIYPAWSSNQNNPGQDADNNGYHTDQAGQHIKQGQFGVVAQVPSLKYKHVKIGNRWYDIPDGYIHSTVQKQDAKNEKMEE